MSAGDITAIHTNITRAEHEQWKVTALNIVAVLEKTTHKDIGSTFPLSYLEAKEYLVPLVLFSTEYTFDSSAECVEDALLITIEDARLFIEDCENIIQLIFTDDKFSTSQFNGYNPAVGKAIETMHSRQIYNHPVFKYFGKSIKGIASTIVATNSFFEHRIIISYLIEFVNENKFSPEILPEYLQLSFKREFNFPWTGQPVNSQLLIDFLLHCHYKPFLIQFTNKQESTS